MPPDCWPRCMAAATAWFWCAVLSRNRVFEFVGFLWFGRGFCGHTKGMVAFFLNGDGSDSSPGDAGVGDYASGMVGVVLSCSAWTQRMKQRKAL